MVAIHRGRRYDFVAIDLNTQHDFCVATGAHPAANTGQLVPALRRVVAWTRRNGVPVVSSINSCRLREVRSDGEPRCCVDGSIGQQKMEFTIFPTSTRVEIDNTLCIPLDLFQKYQQLVFRERTDDLLANPKADRFLTQIRTTEFILFGNITERSVKALALGLLARNRPVSIVRDACGYWDIAAADFALRQVVAKGGTLISTDELLSRKLMPRYRYGVPKRDSLGSGNGRDLGESTNGKKRAPARNGKLFSVPIDSRIRPSQTRR